MTEKRVQRPSILGQALRTYQQEHHVTQEDLAVLLDVGPRTLRRYLSGETLLTDNGELRRIADRLGIPYDHLGIAPSIYVALSVADMYATIDRVWSLIQKAYIADARVVAENLVRQVVQQLRVNDPAFVRAVTLMYHAAGHATSLGSWTHEVDHAIYYYEQMEYFARLLKDDTLVSVALAYQGDMLRRKGDMIRAIPVLEAASSLDVLPRADASARGNALQLLGRVYMRTQREQDFFEVMAQSFDCAQQSDEKNTGIAGVVRQYNTAMVYEEYAKGYDMLGKTHQALDHVERAKKVAPLTKSNEDLFKVALAEILIHSGDMRNGEPLAVEAAIYSREHGHMRRLERIYALKRFISQQMVRLGKTDLALSEALEGSIEY